MLKANRTKIYEANWADIPEPEPIKSANSNNNKNNTKNPEEAAAQWEKEMREIENMREEAIKKIKEANEKSSKK